MTISEDRIRARKEKTFAFAREHILEAALKCFAQSGYAQTKIADIAAAAGYTAASLYTYFPGKKEIFVAAADHFVSGVEAALGEVPEQAHDDFDAFAEDVRARVRSLCAFGDERSEVLAFFMRLRWSGDAVLDEVRPKEAGICRAGDDTPCAAEEGHGPFRLHDYMTRVWRALGIERFGWDPDVFASLVGGTIEAFFVRKYLMLRGGTLSEDADAIAELLLFGLRGRR
jgi:AcrR family transcriptional regulator